MPTSQSFCTCKMQVKHLKPCPAPGESNCWHQLLWDANSFYWSNCEAFTFGVGFPDIPHEDNSFHSPPVIMALWHAQMERMHIVFILKQTF